VAHALGEARGHHGHMTSQSPSPRTDESTDAQPPDPVAYDSPRAERARAKGLKGHYITGGDDPALAIAQAEERRLGKILLAMVIAIVSAGFIIGIAVALLLPNAA
jgi:hypothetical protein